MNRQEWLLRGLIILCCGLIVVSPLLSIFFYDSNLLISTLALYALILLIPAAYWHYISEKISTEKGSEDEKAKIYLSSILVGIFCGTIAGVYGVLLNIYSVLSKALVSFSAPVWLVNYTGLLSLLAPDMISLQLFSAFVFLFLLETVAVMSTYLAKKKGFSSSETKDSLKKNLLVAIVLFAIFFVVAWLLGNYFGMPF